MSDPQQATQRTMIELLRADVARLIKSVEGNGKTGLCDTMHQLQGQVEVLSRQLNEHLKEYEENKKSQREFMQKILGGVITSVIVFIITNIITISTFTSRLAEQLSNTP